MRNIYFRIQITFDFLFCIIIITFLLVFSIQQLTYLNTREEPWWQTISWMWWMNDNSAHQVLLLLVDLEMFYPDTTQQMLELYTHSTPRNTSHSHTHLSIVSWRLACRELGFGGAWSIARSIRTLSVKVNGISVGTKTPVRFVCI